MTPYDIEMAAQKRQRELLKKIEEIIRETVNEELDKRLPQNRTTKKSK